MARKRMVTRTILTTKASVLCLDVVAGEPFNKEVTLAGTFKDDKHMLKEAEKIINSETVKAVHIAHSEVVETLYGMAEADFIASAEVLPPRMKCDSDEDE